MTRRRCLQALAALSLPPLWPGAVRAGRAWPAGPIRLVVPFPPGGSSDTLGRLLAERLSRQLGTSIVVENRPGGTTQIGTELVANALPDGQTLLLGAASSFTILPNLRRLPYSLDSFDAIGGVADYIAVLAVRTSLPVGTVQELVEYARRHPGQLTFGSAGEASAGHVYGGTLAHQMGLNVMHVPFRGSAAAVNAAVAGEVDFVIDGAATAMVKAGRLKPLATFYRKRHPELPEVPTLTEAGIQIHEAHAAGWGVLVPKGTPGDVSASVSAALQQVLADPDMQPTLRKANSVASWQTPQVFRGGLLADRDFYARLLPAIGLRAV